MAASSKQSNTPENVKHRHARTKTPGIYTSSNGKPGGLRWEVKYTDPATGQTVSTQVDSMLHKGALGILSKPFVVDDLLAAIARGVRGSALFQRGARPVAARGAQCVFFASRNRARRARQYAIPAWRATGRGVRVDTLFLSGTPPVAACGSVHRFITVKVVLMVSRACELL